MENLSEIDNKGKSDTGPYPLIRDVGKSDTGPYPLIRDVGKSDTGPYPLIRDVEIYKLMGIDNKGNKFP